MSEEARIAAVKAFGEQVDFGKAATDYGRFRAGFPDAFFQRLAEQCGPFAGKAALDVGTGAGTVARGLARMGAVVTGLDPSTALMDEARKLDAEQGVSVAYVEGRAEAPPFPDAAFDIVTAGQCWHWFDRPRAAREAMR
jgi:ubiquinone/menaquinone biosynthesis C-methylase UbiE